MKLWKIFPVFAQEKSKKKKLTHKNFELYEVQWSRLLHLWSSKEATRDEKKMMKRNFSKVLQCVKLEEKQIKKILKNLFFLL